MLTKISTDLITHFLGKADIKSFLKDQAIRKLYDNLSDNSYQNTKVSMSNSNSFYPQSLFIAKSLEKKINKRDNVLTLRWLTEATHSVKNKLHIYLEDKDDLPDTELLVKAISFITAFSDKPRKITIHLCLLKDKKTLRKNQTKITQMNVNSGSNKYSEIESEICIFRMEEAIKVIMHEVIHGLRFSQLGSHDDITYRLCQKYDIASKDIVIDESYTEVWARIMNCLFITTQTETNNYQHFCTLLALEREFAIYQANKLRQFAKKTQDKNFDRYTNVSAYYLVVGEIFSQFTEFLKICNCLPYLSDKDKCYEYIYNLDIIKKRKISLSDKFYSTMRMSLSELEI